MITMPTQTPTRSAGRETAPPGANPWLLWSIETPDERQVLSVAELAECRCPDLCDRDHANE